MKMYDKCKIILEENEKARNSDKEMIWAYWVKEHRATEDKGGWDNFQMGRITKRDFFSATSPESIRRARQKIQELHKELGPTSSAVKRRRGVKQATKGTFIFREE